jgi:hypothetical protein
LARTGSGGDRLLLDRWSGPRSLGREKLAADAGTDDYGTDSFGGVALAHNVRAPADVDAVISSAAQTGAAITSPASRPGLPAVGADDGVDLFQRWRRSAANRCWHPSQVANTDHFVVLEPAKYRSAMHLTRTHPAPLTPPPSRRGRAWGSYPGVGSLPSMGRWSWAMVGRSPTAG